MTLAGAVILFICFIGPITPPIIGLAVGRVYDVFKVKRESVETQTRRRLAERVETT